MARAADRGLACGPVEAAILADLAPSIRARRADARGASLRVLEGGEGPPIVMLHGRGGAATAWATLLPAIARKRRAIAVDLPGFGASIGARYDGGDAASAIAFFVDPIEAWMEAEGLTDAVVMGHSLGGLVAVELALRARVAPRALVLIAPMGVGAEASLAARLFFRLGPERVARVAGPASFAKITSAEGPRAAALAFELHAVPGGRPDASRAFDALMPLVGPLPNRRERLGSIDAPALVIAGDHDEVFPAPVAIAASAALRRGEIDVFPAGHAPHIEAPLRMLSRLDAFLSRVARSAVP